MIEEKKIKTIIEEDRRKMSRNTLLAKYYKLAAKGISSSEDLKILLENIRPYDFLEARLGKIKYVSYGTEYLALVEKDKSYYDDGGLNASDEKLDSFDFPSIDYVVNFLLKRAPKLQFYLICRRGDWTEILIDNYSLKKEVENIKDFHSKIQDEKEESNKK